MVDILGGIWAVQLACLACCDWTIDGRIVSRQWTEWRGLFELVLEIIYMFTILIHLHKRERNMYIEQSIFHLIFCSFRNA